jgi:hypothetical protein
MLFISHSQSSTNPQPPVNPPNSFNPAGWDVVVGLDMGGRWRDGESPGLLHKLNFYLASAFVGGGLFLMGTVVHGVEQRIISKHYLS